MRKRIITLLLGMALGMALLSGGYAAASTVLTATPSSQTIYIDGQQVTMTAYLIGGSNYVRLRDIGEAVGFNVYWDGTVRIESDKPYTGVAPGNTASVPTQQPSGTVTIPTDGSRYVPKNGDKIACNDGTVYAVTDASGYDANMFAEGPLGPLPTAACDWSSFPAMVLPQAEARHFSLPDGEYLFLRNLYETRRMQYTLMNLAGTHPDTSQGGRLQGDALRLHQSHRPGRPHRPLLLALAGERAVQQLQLLPAWKILRGSLGCVQERQISLYRVQDRNSYLNFKNH